MNNKNQLESPESAKNAIKKSGGIDITCSRLYKHFVEIYQYLFNGFSNLEDLKDKNK